MVFSDPFDAELLAWAEETLKAPFEPGLAAASDLAACLGAHEEALRAIDGTMGAGEAEAPGVRAVENLSLRSIAEDRSPIVRLVNSTLYDALKGGASDIHLETIASGLAIKYRLDGVLVPVGTVPGPETAEQVISRIKVMAELLNAIQDVYLSKDVTIA